MDKLTPERNDKYSWRPEHAPQWGFLCILVLIPFVFYEALLQIPLPLKVYAITILLTALVAVASAIRFRNKALPYMYVLFLITLSVLYAVPWGPRKVFLNDFNKIQIGMSRAEVGDLMSGYITGTGWPGPSGAAASSTLTDVGSGRRFQTTASPSGELALVNSVVYRHSKTGNFDSDWGIVMFEDGKVAQTAFSPD